MPQCWLAGKLAYSFFQKGFTMTTTSRVTFNFYAEGAL